MRGKAPARARVCTCACMCMCTHGGIQRARVGVSGAQRGLGWEASWRGQTWAHVWVRDMCMVPQDSA